MSSNHALQARPGDDPSFIVLTETKFRYEPGALGMGGDGSGLEVVCEPARAHRGTLPQPFFHATHHRHGGVTAIATVAAVAAVAAIVAVAPPIRLTLDFGVSISRLRGRPEGPESLSARCATVEVETIVEVLFATPTMQAVQDSWMGTGYPTRSWGVNFCGKIL